jgi:hypothetical protein
MYTQGGCGTSLAPPAVATLGLPNPAAPTQGLWAPGTGPGLAGLGCPGCGGTCGERDGMNGLTMDGTGLFGTGIFGDSAPMTSPSTWGPWEWGVVAIGAFAVLSMLDTTRRGARHVSERGRRIKGGFTSPISGSGGPKKKGKKKS